jgi:hypothetical protein
MLDHCLSEDQLLHQRKQLTSDKFNIDDNYSTPLVISPPSPLYQAKLLRLTGTTRLNSTEFQKHLASTWELSSPISLHVCLLNSNNQLMEIPESLTAAECSYYGLCIWTTFSRGQNPPCHLCSNLVESPCKSGLIFS